MPEKPKHWTEEEFEEALAAALAAASTGTLPGAAVSAASRRFWLQWLQQEGFLCCAYCGVEFPDLDAVREHERWEC